MTTSSASATPRRGGRSVSAATKPAKAKAVQEQAAEQPVAHVVVETPLAHLDRPFDYLVATDQSDAAVPGARVKVRFAGKRLDGYIVGRSATSDHEGRLAFLDRVVSAEPVVSDDLIAMARAVADHYAGSLADVLRLVIPPRHAKVEAEPQGPLPNPGAAAHEPGEWQAIEHGPAFLAALERGDSPRGVWTAVPSHDWTHAVALAVQATRASGRGALVVVPDGRDCARLATALSEVNPDDPFVVLTADVGPAERYRRWLKVRRGEVQVVVGTRAAAFAPVANLGLVVVWDDGDDLHAEQRAPYPHVREVLSIRSQLGNTALLVGGFVRSCEGQRLVRSAWAQPLTAARDTVRSQAPTVRTLGSDAAIDADPAVRAARLPTLAWRTAREALAQGPVLVQVPRRGYVPGLACQQCRAPARCAHCQGPLRLDDRAAAPVCAWCARSAMPWKCPSCSANQLRATRVGARRTAEELGRAFPSIAVKTSGRDGILDTVGAAPALVVATPGAEPVAEGGYAAALLLDGDALLGRADLRAGDEALRRWMNAASLVRPSSEGGRVVIVAEDAAPAVQALVRWDSETFAERELVERTAARLPPAARIATLTSTTDAVRELIELMELPPHAEVLGPVALDDESGQVRMVVRVPLADGAALARALHAAQGVRSAKKSEPYVSVRIDPLDL